MVKVYATDITKLSDNFFRDNLENLSKNDIDKIKRFVKKEDRMRSFVARWLIYRILNEHAIHTSMDFSDIIKYNEYNKPYLENNGLEFNISHSGNYVVAATSSKSVGIDIEQISDIDVLKLSKNFFCKQEYEQILHKPDNQRKEMFFKIWTLKESYIKNVGKGLNIALDSFCINFDGDKIKSDDKNFNFKVYDIDKDYKLSVCALEREFAKDIIFLHPN